VPDGIGVGYSVQKARLRFSVTSRHPDQKWAANMVQNLESALAVMGDVCDSHLAEIGKEGGGDGKKGGKAKL
jgi:hypothetical protein